MARRRITPWESRDFQFHSDIALALHLVDKSAVSHILDKLDRSVLGLHLRLEDRCYPAVPSPAPRFWIPNQVRGLQRAIAWLNNRHPIDDSQRFGVLGYSDSKLIPNVSHSLSDGGCSKFLVDHIFEPLASDLPQFPPTLE
jgi:hypothetical protein